MAKRMLKSNKVPACQRELNALLNAMDRKEKGDGNVNIRILQTALEHCLHASVRVLVEVVEVVGRWGMVGLGCVCVREGGRKGRVRRIPIVVRAETCACAPALHD